MNVSYYFLFDEKNDRPGRVAAPQSLMGALCIRGIIGSIII